MSEFLENAFASILVNMSVTNNSPHLSTFQGYSVTTGDFNGDGEPLDVAVGMPRGHGLRGQVVIYDSVLNNLHNVTGYQIGAYFVSHLLKGPPCDRR